MSETLNGRVCPMDRIAFRQEDELVCCSVCKAIHHKRCWSENRTCTTLDCRGSPVAMVVAVEATPEVSHLNMQLDDLRTTLHRLTRKLDQALAQEHDSAAKAIEALGKLLDSSMKEGKEQSKRVLAGLAETLLRIRSLDYTVTRHRYPGGSSDPHHIASVVANGEGHR